MKAILVIDVPNENLWRTSNDIYERMKGYKCSFKPMPEKKVAKIVGFNTTDYVENKLFADGWNDCLDEITGETE